MKFRCTAQFIRSYDELEVSLQHNVTEALKGFAITPFMPSHQSRILQDQDPTRIDDDVWCLPCGKNCFLTYSFITETDDDHVICVLRNVGIAV
jgi:hypothetical protein